MEEKGAVSELTKVTQVKIIQRNKMDSYTSTKNQEADSQLHTLISVRDGKKITWFDVFIYPISIYVVIPDTGFSTALVRSIS